MRTLLILLVAVVAAASAVPHSKAHHKTALPTHSRREPVDDWDGYDCTGLDDGHYPHPTDCTKFIHCHNGRTAEKPCPDCGVSPLCGGEKYLFFSVPMNRCEWPVETECHVHQTPEPITDAPTTTTAAPTTTTPTTTTEAAPEPTTPDQGGGGDGEYCGGVKDGDSCDKNDCEPCGYCKDKMSFFFHCVRHIPSDPKQPITGTIKHASCGKDLWWNPDLKPENATAGGSCDEWDYLSDDVKRAYLEDPDCVEPEPLCDWGQEEEDKCTGKHWYFHPGWDPETQNLTCNGDLIWDDETETCRECEKVEGCGKDADGKCARK